jgi:D-glycero-D-manno-heptose 1,7-bisphosphate phosphatase
MSKNKAVFLDRDGTINVEIHYLHEPEKFQFIENVPEGLKLLISNGFKVIVITNQGAIGKGYYGHEDVEKTHQQMKNLLEEENIELTDIYYCPHCVAENCNCRKPLPGMVLKAIEDHQIDPSKSWMIGDKLSDITAGNRANLKSILVLTGYGEEHKSQLESMKKIATTKSNIEDLNNIPNFIVTDLFEASQLICGQR